MKEEYLSPFHSVWHSLSSEVIMTTILFHSVCGSSFRLEDYEDICYVVVAYRLTLILETNQVTQVSLLLILCSSSLRSITSQSGVSGNVL